MSKRHMPDDLSGTTIGGYEILHRIGEGGMASVYLARQQSMNRQVALKLLPERFKNDDMYLQRFEREVKIVSQLEHRNIVPVYDYGEFNGLPYIVMRYMPAGSVDELVRQGPLSPEHILRIIEQIAPALDYAHSRGVLHRDLKPSNVLIDDDGGAFITDFGIARMIGDAHPGITTQGVVGTPSYMSPEQAQGKDLDGRSDIYALGVMFFEMATGRRPFENDTAYSIAVMQVTQPPPAPRKLNPALSSALEIVILKALKKNPDDRYQTAANLAEALKLALERPTAIHDTEPNLKPLLKTHTPPAQPAVQPSQPAQSYQAPSSHISRQVVMPSNDLRSQIRKRRRQNPLVSALIGGSIGCGLLAILLVGGFFAAGFLLPSDETTQPTQTTAPADDTEEASEPQPAIRTISVTSTLTLDATSFAARETLIARNADSGATETADAEATASAPTRTPVIDPVELRGTPQLRGTLEDASGVIVYADIRGETRTLEIVTLDLDTWVETQLTQSPNANSSYPVPSPDGEWIAFQSDTDGDFDIYIMNPGGGQLQKMTFNDYRDRLAAWSPDGEWIIYSSDTRNDGTYDLRRVAYDGSADEEVFSNGQRISHPRYSPDGRYVIFTVGPDPRNAATWEIGRLDLETGEYDLLTHNDVRDASPVFSPDGQTILYSTFDESDNALAVMDIDGQNQRIIYDSSGSDWAANYSPDGQFIVVTSNVNGDDQLYLMTVDGRGAQAITSEGGLYASWIPDSGG